MPKHNKNKAHINFFAHLIAVLFVSVLFMEALYADNKDDELIQKYVDTKGTNIITFDTSNIKQFWVDNSVCSRNNSFDIILKENKTNSQESVPLKIQLANVNEAQDCKIEIIAVSSSYSFNVLNSQLKTISSSSDDSSFLNYCIVSSSFHLEDTKDLMFYIKFSSKSLDPIHIKKIILSFSSNLKGKYLATPGKIKIGASNYTKSTNYSITDNMSSFLVSGTWYTLLANKRILVSNQTIKNTLRVKNIGSEPTHIYCGYAPYTKDHLLLQNRNNPYNGSNSILNVISSKEGSNSIVVDSYPEWKKNCYLVYDAKDDMSDFPNFSFSESEIINIKRINDTQTEITFSKPLKKPVKPGTKARVHSPRGNTYLYTNDRVLQPGEEFVFESSITKNDACLQFSSDALCHGVYYVVPVLLSQSVNRNNPNTLQISEYTIEY